jgi:hypothetical protein
MLKIKFHKDGICIPDEAIEGWIDNLINLYNYYKKDYDEKCKISISNEIIVDAIRLRVLKGDIDYKEIEFEYKGQKLYLNEYANFSEYTEEFCTMGLNIVTQILNLQRKKRKDIKNEK